jgi:hypothetical protein
MKFAILLPTRGRPAEFDRLVRSINDTISQKHEVELFIGMDKDDPERKHYYDCIHAWQLTKKPELTIIAIEDNRKPTYQIWNDLARIRSWKNSPDYFIMGNDDVVYKTEQWDFILSGKISVADHPFYLYWFNDGINGGDHCAFPIISKYWVGAVGYFVPEHFKYFYSDTWTYDIAKRAEVLRYIPEVETIHKHFSVDNNVKFDETYRFNRQGDVNQYDARMFEETSGQRQMISQEILTRIQMWKVGNKLITDLK